MKVCTACHLERSADSFLGKRGPTKRCATCRRYFNTRDRKIKAGTWTPDRTRTSTPRANHSPTLIDLQWAAGFLEGEGNFDKGNYSERVSAAQVNLEPLTRLQELFGGTLRPLTKRPHIYAWCVHGPRARGVMMTLYSLLSEKRRRQVTAALARCYS